MNAADTYQTGTMEFPLKWQHLKKGIWNKRTRKGFKPSLGELTRDGQSVPAPDYYSVFLAAPKPEDVADLREWLMEYAERQYSIFGRFSWTQFDYCAEQTCDGVRFHFKNADIALLFKLTWSDRLYDPAP